MYKVALYNNQVGGDENPVVEGKGEKENRRKRKGASEEKGKGKRYTFSIFPFSHFIFLPCEEGDEES